MPKTSSKSGPNYRWSTGDTIHPLGWSNISGSFAVWNLTDEGGAQLLSAVNLQIAVAALLGATLYL